MRLKGFILLSALILAACDGAPGNRDSNPFHLPPIGYVADKTRGAELFRQNCSSCHGRAGSGSNTGPPLVHETYNPSHHADLAFHLAVKNGVRRHHWRFGDMPPQPQVSPEAVADIVAYVRELQRRAGID
ncbi:MAG: c-type cytochrome [Gammaproteobacteria bacterium]|nr:c-type cytochrome [Gammaproteobacteria bacterium]